MRVSYAPDYFVPLPEGHPFPMGKFPTLRRILLDEGLLSPDEIVRPRQAAWSDLRLVHAPGYLERLRRGGLGRRARRRMGLPWSEALMRRSRLAVQGTLDAAWMALRDGVAANLAGGTHHAFAGHGEGFCVLNDVAVAVRVLRRSGWTRRTLVVDLDVHQGNGTASVLGAFRSVYTLSIHGARNYPFEKVPSSRDVGLEDGTGDRDYLDVLGDTLEAAFDEARPDLVFYLAGVDPAAGDRYGRLSLSPSGLYDRDRTVLEACARRDVPVTLLLSGGYARTDQATAELHALAHRAAAEVFGR